MNKIIAFILILACTCSLHAGNKQFDTMVIFGDSLSDNGNLYRYMWNKLPLSPPYYAGRFSNGPLWIERLYDSYYQDYREGFQDYAVGGAGAVLSYKENLPYTLTFELNNYLYWHTYGKKETSLYTIWIGANNYLNGPTNVESITDSVVAAIGNVVERIIGYGGNKFFLVNLPDLGRIPQARDMKLQPLLTQLVDLHNQKLTLLVNALRQKYPDVIFIYFDVHSIFNAALDHPSDFGLSNVEDSCYLGSYTGWLIPLKPDDELLFSFLKQQDKRFDTKQWDIIRNNPVLREAALVSFTHTLLPSTYQAKELNCEGFLFWDRVHPTATTHSYIAQKARELLDESGIEAVFAETNPESTALL
ncbi:MAG: SGNH/GDSL hydrolase family protein [Legionella sp.]|nr:SGNH/GDSL hydrolase family protein [Legionella sp.]